MSWYVLLCLCVFTSFLPSTFQNEVDDLNINLLGILKISREMAPHLFQFLKQKNSLNPNEIYNSAIEELTSIAGSLAPHIIEYLKNKTKEEETSLTELNNTQPERETQLRREYEKLGLLFQPYPRLEDVGRGSDVHRVYMEELSRCNIRLDEAQQKLISTSVRHQVDTELLRSDNRRLQQQLQETNINLEDRIISLLLRTSKGFETKDQYEISNNIEIISQKLEIKLEQVVEQLKNNHKILEDINQNLKETCKEGKNDKLTDIIGIVMEYKTQQLAQQLQETKSQEMKNQLLQLQLTEANMKLKGKNKQITETENKVKELEKEKILSALEISTLKEKVNNLNEIKLRLQSLNEKLENNSKSHNQDIMEQIFNTTKLQALTITNIKTNIKNVEQKLEMKNNYINKINENNMCKNLKFEFEKSMEDKMRLQGILDEHERNYTQLFQETIALQQKIMILNSSKQRVESEFHSMKQENQFLETNLLIVREDLQKCKESSAKVNASIVTLQNHVNQMEDQARTMKTVTQVGGDSRSRFNNGLAMVQLGNNFYYFSKEIKKSWYEARTFCITHGLHLVVIDSASEQQLLYQHKQKIGQDYTWLGGSDEGHEGVWVWSATRRTLIYHNWNIGQPNSRTAANCLEMRNGGKWHSYTCTARLAFICERVN